MRRTFLNKRLSLLDLIGVTKVDLAALWDMEGTLEVVEISLIVGEILVEEEAMVVAAEVVMDSEYNEFGGDGSNSAGGSGYSSRGGNGGHGRAYENQAGGYGDGVEEENILNKG